MTSEAPLSLGGGVIQTTSCQLTANTGSGGDKNRVGPAFAERIEEFANTWGSGPLPVGDAGPAPKARRIRGGERQEQRLRWLRVQQLGGSPGLRRSVP